jgi:hypothetical protein
MLFDTEGGGKPSRSLFDWHDVRFIGAVAGRYALSDRRDGEEGKVPIYACRLCSISTRIAVVVAPVMGAEGELVAAHFDDFGIVRGTILRRLPSGFVMQLQLNAHERDKLGAKIVWHKRRVIDGLPDKREHKRIVPRDPRSTLTLADGQSLDCFVIDVSQSGVAVSAAILPPIGTPMAVGKAVGRVVRHLDTGFALQFAQLQDLETLEAVIAPLGE